MSKSANMAAWAESVLYSDPHADVSEEAYDAWFAEPLTFTSLPEGGTTKVTSGKNFYNMVVREAETRWVLGQNAEGHDVVVDLTTRHDPDNKVFRTSLTWGVVEKVERHPADGPGVVSIYRWASDHRMEAFGRVPVSRYSKKALEETHQWRLEVLEEMFAETDAVLVFNEAAERNGLVA